MAATMANSRSLHSALGWDKMRSDEMRWDETKWVIWTIPKPANSSDLFPRRRTCLAFNTQFHWNSRPNTELTQVGVPASALFTVRAVHTNHWSFVRFSRLDALSTVYKHQHGCCSCTVAPLYFKCSKIAFTRNWTAVDKGNDVYITDKLSVFVRWLI